MAENSELWEIDTAVLGDLYEFVWLQCTPAPQSDSVLSQDSPPGLPPASPVLRLSPCLHRSLEGLNQELEEVFVKEQGDEELLRVSYVPSGRIISIRLEGTSKS